MNFLSISSSNLDEFFMVHVARVMEGIISKSDHLDPSGLSVREQMALIVLKGHDFVKKQYKCFKEVIVPLSKKSGFKFLKMKDLSEDQKEFTKKYFKEILFPILTPLSVDRSKPFPFLISKSLNLAVRIFKKNTSNFYIIQVPSIIPRFLKIPSEKNNSFVFLEDVIIQNISDFFDTKEIESVCVFRITRNADFDLKEEGEDLLEKIEKSVKRRKRGTIVRLEISKKPDKITRKFLCDVLDVENYEVYKIDGPIDFTFLRKFLELKEIKRLKKKDPDDSSDSKEFLDENDVFKTIKKHDKILFHPYESFDLVLKFLQQASEDENVLAIKQTLYRVSKDSPVIKALMKAAENGKQVTVLVELKARFDEESNIIWAKKLERAGCHVVYGVPGLKTHCKVLLVVRKEKNKIIRYVHFGTGNYNEITAKIYTDIGFLTCKNLFGSDASLLFNTLTAGYNPPKYSKIICSPFKTRSFLKEMVKNEIKNCKKGLKSEITIKVNSLSDVETIKLFYKASNAGVKINLIVRGICCLVPKFNNLSENINVVSIVGKFLEHSRVFKFCNNEKEKIFIGSADLMPRNLDERIELLVPIENEKLKKRVSEFLNKMLNDNVNSRFKLSDSSYKTNKNSDKKIIDCQSF